MSTAERTVLSAILYGGTETLDGVGEILAPEDFQEQRHALLYRSMLSMREEDGGVDPELVFTWLHSQGLMERVGGADYLASLGNLQVNPANAEAYARKVREASRKNRLLQALLTIDRASKRKSVDEIGAELEAALASLEAGTTDAIVSPGDLLDEALAEDGEEGMLTGLIPLDAIMGGFKRGALTILGARPSNGKSAMALNMAYRVAKRGYTVGIFSLEVFPRQVTQNLLRIAHGKDLRGVRSTPGVRESRQTLELADLPIHIFDLSGLSSVEVKRKSARLKRRHGLDLLILDYLQIMDVGGGQRYQEIGDITRTLKLMAKDLNIAVLALSQLSRSAEGEEIPSLAHLRESGNIEQDADVVVLQSLTKDRDGKRLDPFQALVNVAKHRNGDTGIVSLAMHGPSLTFRVPSPVFMGGSSA